MFIDRVEIDKIIFSEETIEEWMEAQTIKYFQHSYMKSERLTYYLKLSFFYFCFPLNRCNGPSSIKT